MDPTINEIQQIAGTAAEQAGFFLVDLNIRGDKNKRIIEIFIDGEKSISAEDLAEISRSINKIIEEKNYFSGSYRLDVSSPGTERPLKFLKQYPKHLNRKFEITYKDIEEKNFTGKLFKIENEDLYFIKNKQEIKINFNDIIKATVIISFS